MYKSLTGADGEKLVWDVSQRYMLRIKEAKFDRLLVRSVFSSTKLNVSILCFLYCAML